MLNLEYSLSVLQLWETGDTHVQNHCASLWQHHALFYKQLIWLLQITSLMLVPSLLRTIATRRNFVLLRSVYSTHYDVVIVRFDNAFTRQIPHYELLTFIVIFFCHWVILIFRVILIHFAFSKVDVSGIS